MHGSRRIQPSIADAVRALARRTGMAEADLLEDWGERSAIREFEGGQRRAVAEAEALDDLRRLREPQRRLI